MTPGALCSPVYCSVAADRLTLFWAELGEIDESDSENFLGGFEDLFQVGGAFVARLLSLEMGDRLLDVASQLLNVFQKLIVLARGGGQAVHLVFLPRFDLMNES